jgi:hypothetical protein
MDNVKMTNEDTKKHMAERIELRRIYDEDISPRIVLGNYEEARNLLNKYPDIKDFLEPSQWRKMYDFVNGE